MILLFLAFKSLRSRRVTTSLTVFSIALSVFLLIGVDRVREGTQDGFSGTVSQVDLVVGARGGSLPLLLYAIFHIGTANNNLAYTSYLHFRDHPAVLWSIPFSMGDSHRGFRVVATNDEFYRHYRYRGDHSIALSRGVIAEGIFETVLGSEVASRLHYQLGQKIVLSHGLEGSFLEHKDRQFTVVGILDRTSTPVDSSIYITLYGEGALHYGWHNGSPPAIGTASIPQEQITKADLSIDEISAFVLRSKSRISTLFLQREINTYKPEPLTAIVPGVALHDLWGMMKYADMALSLVSGAVLVVGLLAMLMALYTALNERRHEIAILRAIGLHARQIFMLFVIESTLVSAAGTLVGLVSVYALLFGARHFIEANFGIPIAVVGVSGRVALYIGVVVCSGSLLGCIPAFRAYRNALADGLSAH